jgi:hypothetical protein
MSVWRKERANEFADSFGGNMLVASAILKDGVIYTGKRHHNILNDAKPFGYLKDGHKAL